jgi:type I restriction enzyme S subunit
MKPYPKYVDSGVEWIGEVPEGWEVKKMKWVALINPSKIMAINRLGIDDEITFLPMENVGEKGELNTSIRKNLTDVIKGFTYFEKSDVIVAKITPCFENGKGASLTNLPTDIGFGSTEFHVLRPVKVDQQFLFYLTKSYTFSKLGVASMTGAAGQRRVPNAFIENYRLGLPADIGEQSRIAAYLDCKTAQIDELIAKKHRLIELLTEERATVINQAITKGLDPSVKMKDSGVEWLGDVPEHWALKPLKYIVTLQRGHDLPAEKRIGGNVPVITSAGATGMHNQAMAKAPGIVTGRYGTIGTFYLIDMDYWPLNTTLYSINLHDNLPKYLWYVLQTLSPIFLLNSSKSAVPGVDRNDLHPTVTVIPPSIYEQAAIVSFLEHKTTQIDQTITKTEKQIQLLLEYRTTLISGVVTGKIDVREEVDA